MNNFTKNPFSPLIMIIDDKSQSFKKIKLDEILDHQGFRIKYSVSDQNIIKTLNNFIPNVLIVNSNTEFLTANEICLYARSLDNLRNCIIFIVEDENYQVSKKLTLAEGGPQKYLLNKTVSELVAAIKENFRFYRSPETSIVLKYSDIILNLHNYTVMRQNKYIKLGPTEFKILQCFLENQKNILSRNFIMSYVWGKSDKIESRTIDVHINRLRNALKFSREELPVIETIRSLGYCLRQENQE